MSNRRKYKADQWCRVQDGSFIWTGILLSTFLGFVGGLFVGIGSHDWVSGVLAFFGLTLLALHLTFWRVGV